MPVLRAGEVIGPEGRWQVERKVGEGQFSEVYQVMDMQSRELVSETVERCVAAAACMLGGACSRRRRLLWRGRRRRARQQRLQQRQAA